MDTMIIESRYFILSSLTREGQRIIDNHGKYWHVVEEKLRIPRINRRGYVLRAADGHVIILRKNNSEHFKVGNEFFKEIEITLDCEETLPGDDTTEYFQESV